MRSCRTSTYRPRMLACSAVVFAHGIACGAALADKAFTGEDAAYIDWAWKNCEIKSTTKQHGLVDEARNKNNDAFQRSYEASYLKLVAANPEGDSAAVRRTCTSVKEWYGSSGTRIAALIEAKGDRGSVAGTSVGSKSSSQAGGGGNRGGGGGGKRGGF